MLNKNDDELLADLDKELLERQDDLPFTFRIQIRELILRYRSLKKNMTRKEAADAALFSGQ